jgi:hypothetical protein
VVRDVKFSPQLASHKQTLAVETSNPSPDPHFLNNTRKNTKMTGVNPAIFQDLQARVDEDTAVRDVSAAPRPDT